MLMQAQTPQTCLLPPGLQQLQAPLARLRRLCPRVRGLRGCRQFMMSGGGPHDMLSQGPALSASSVCSCSRAIGHPLAACSFCSYGQAR